MLLGHFGAGAHLHGVTDLTLTESRMTDRVVQLAAAGDESAFASLVAAHHIAMVRVAYAITGDGTAAAEAAQAAWASAWRRLGSLRDPERVRSWLVAIAANEARQLVRRERSHPVVDISELFDLRAAGSDPADGIASVDLARALRRLDADDRVLLALRFVAGLDSTQIAAELGISASGVRSRLSRLIERLRSELDHA